MKCRLGISIPKWEFVNVQEHIMKWLFGDFNSQLGIHKWSKTYHEVTIGNLNSQLGIHKCTKTYYEIAIGNFNSQLGIHKWSKTYYEMAIGNLTPFGELKIYKLNGEGRACGAPACHGASAD